MIDFAKKEENRSLWETKIVKSGFVTSKDGSRLRDYVGWIFSRFGVIRVDELAASLIELAMNGSDEETLQNNQDMVDRGRQMLRQA